MKIAAHREEFLEKVGQELHNKYQSNTPFPNISIDDFFETNFLEKILDEFPDLSGIAEYKFSNPNEKKLATKGEIHLGIHSKQLVRFLNSEPFIAFLSSLTGIEGLIPDPYLLGGGYHELKPGGYLKIHSDFNKHPKTNLDRRINVIVYLNKNWSEDYGGEFELWNENMTECVTKISPIFNRMAIFSTNSKSYHGNPNIVKCPENQSRKSIAMYYYTNGRPQSEVLEFLEDHSTIFKARIGEDSIDQTEKYLQEKIRVAKAKKKKEKLVLFFKNLIPPIIWEFLKKIFN